MIKIHWKPDCGLVVPDGAVAETVTRLLENLEHEKLFYVGCATLIYEFRLRVKRGEIPYDGISFVVGNETLAINEHGKFNTWPDGFCDLLDTQLTELLDAPRF